MSWILAGVATIVTAAFIFVFHKKRQSRKATNAQQGEDGKNNVNYIELPFDSLLDEADDSRQTKDNNKNPVQDVEFVIKDRTFWSLHRFHIIASFVIFVSAIFVAIISIESHQAYSARKEVESEQRNAAISVKQAEMKQKESKYEKAIEDITSRLDSIDAHTKALIPVSKQKPQPSKTKQSNKQGK